MVAGDASSQSRLSPTAHLLLCHESLSDDDDDADSDDDDGWMCGKVPRFGAVAAASTAAAPGSSGKRRLGDDRVREQVRVCASLSCILRGYHSTAE